MIVVVYMSTLKCALSSADRVPGYEPVGRRFESYRARKQKVIHSDDFLFFTQYKYVKAAQNSSARR